MTNHPSPERPVLLADNRVRKAPEEVGVEHHVEPPPWLPEGAAPAVTDEAASAPGQADTGEKRAGTGEQESHGDAAGEQDPGSLNGSHDAGQEQPEAAPDPSAAATSAFNGSHESATPDADPVTYSRDGSYVSDQAGAYDYQPEATYTPDYPAEGGYNHGVSQPVNEESRVPPYPAELPPEQPAAAATKPGIAAAAARVLPKPKRQTTQVKSQTAPTRRANLVIARFEPWSVMKFSFLMSLVAWVVLFVAVALLYYALSGLGVFAAIQRTLQSVTSSQNSAGVNLATWTSASRVLGYTMLIGAVNIVLITALSTIGAMIYNLVTHLGGGIEVTLKETD
jgi:hypothetical protein